MRTRVSLLCDKTIEAGWLVALVVVPLFFNIYSQRVFEPDKLALLRSIALVMGAAWIVRQVEDWRSGRREQAEKSDGKLWRRVAGVPMVLPTLLLIVVNLISTVLSVTPAVSLLGSYQRLQGTYTLLSYLLIFFLMLDGLGSPRQLNRVVTTVILVSFPIAMYGLVQHFGLDPLPWGGNVTTRVASNMGNAIFVAAYLLMVAPLTISRLLENWQEVSGPVDRRDVLLAVLGFSLFAIALIAGMWARRQYQTTWPILLSLLLAVAAQVPIYLLSKGERRTRMLSITVPLTFAFFVGFAWVQEILFPPPEGSEAPGFLWMGILAAIVFVVAMVAFAYYLRKPVARLLLLAGYAIIVLAQVICMVYTGSRGPLIGLMAGGLVYLVVLGLIKRQVWLSWLAGGLALFAIVFLAVFNLSNADWVARLREVPYVGRLGKVLQTEDGTGKVRVLIWEGVTQMVAPHTPLEYPGEEGRLDRWNAIRPLVGYGPESMYVAYNRFYPADLAHYEKRNASPDRSHNETFDALAQTGLLGFAVYMLVFCTAFYFSLKWLGLVAARWQKWLFLALWIGGGLAGALIAWAWRGPAYLGVGIPGGMLLGLAIYLGVAVVRASIAPSARALPSSGPYVLLILALFAAIIGHFAEIHFGIAIAATRTHFWVFCAMLVVLGSRLAPEAQVAETPTSGGAPKPFRQEPAPRTEAAGQSPQGKATALRPKGAAGAPVGSRAGRGVSTSARKPGATLAPRSVARPGVDWWGSIGALSLLVTLVLATFLFDQVTVQEDAGLMGTIVKSLTMRKGEPSPIMLVLVLLTWGMAALVGLADLATRDESAGIRASRWVAGIGVFFGTTFLATLVFGLQHAARLQPVILGLANAQNSLLKTLLSYSTLILFIILAMAAVLAFLSRRSVRPWNWTGRPRDLAVVASVLLLPVAVWIAVRTNLNVVIADILYKQGVGAERAGEWASAVEFYGQAIDLAPDEDFYFLFLGRALMEEGRAATGTQRESLLLQSETALQTAREISPLNTDHSANLARLYRTWGGLSQDPQRAQFLTKALDYYADARKLSPNNAGLINETAQTYAVLGVPDKALQWYETSLALDDRYLQTYQLVGELYMDQGNWVEAQAALERAVSLAPKSADSWSTLGYIYSQQGMLSEAAEAYGKAVELKPGAYVNRKNLALVLQQLGRRDEALLQAQEALKLAPSDQKQSIELLIAQLSGQSPDLTAEDAKKVQALLEESRKKIDGQDWAGAEAILQQVLVLDPKNPPAHSGLAYVYAKQDKIDQAIAESLAVLAVLPDDYVSHKNLALFYQQKGQPELALASAQRALTLAPEEDKPALQDLIDQLTSVSPEPTPSPPAASAGALDPIQRNEMYKAPPAMNIDPTKTYWATIVTAKGDIVVSLSAGEAPQTVNNFVFLAQQGFYDGLTFHRVESQSGFSIIQGGDPLGTGRGGPGYTVPAEIGLPHSEGAIAMARLGDQVNPQKASSGSQFYIARVPIPHLDGGYTVFGYVVQGLDVANKIVSGDKILRIDITVQ